MIRCSVKGVVAIAFTAVATIAFADEHRLHVPEYDTIGRCKMDSGTAAARRVCSDEETAARNRLSGKLFEAPLAMRCDKESRGSYRRFESCTLDTEAAEYVRRLAKPDPDPVPGELPDHFIGADQLIRFGPSGSIVQSTEEFSAYPAVADTQPPPSKPPEIP